MDIAEFMPTFLSNPKGRRDMIMALQSHVGEMDQIECQVNHHFAPGNYAREILIQAGTLVIGKIHKHAHVNVISKGRVSVATEDGVEELEAPITFISQPGTKRAVLALEDTIWTTIHPTESLDIESIEREVIANSYEDYEVFKNKQLIGVMP